MPFRKGAVDEIIGLVAVVVGLMLVIAFIFSTLITQEKLYGNVAREAHAYNSLSYGASAMLDSIEPNTGMRMAVVLADAAYYNSSSLTYAGGIQVDALASSNSLLEQFFGRDNYLMELHYKNNSLSAGPANLTSELKLAYSIGLPAPKEGEFVNFTLRTR